MNRSSPLLPIAWTRTGRRGLPGPARFPVAVVLSLPVRLQGARPRLGEGLLQHDAPLLHVPLVALHA